MAPKRLSLKYLLARTIFTKWHFGTVSGLRDQGARTCGIKPFISLFASQFANSFEESLSRIFW